MASVDLEPSMDLNNIREQSLKTALSIGFTINNVLPLLDEVQISRTIDETVKRLMCLHVAAACAYGFDRGIAMAWLQRENVRDDLSESEYQFIKNGAGDANRFKIQIEGMWALAWSLGLVLQLDFAKPCADTFVALLPNLKTGESGDGLRTKAKLRSNEEVLAACDLAYCLHWSIRQAQLSGNELPKKVQPYVIEERRRALEWLLGDAEWYEITLDT